MSKVKFIILIFKTRWEKIFLIRIKKQIHKQGFTPNYFFNVLHHGTYCSMNTLRRYINHESSSWYLLFNEHTQTLYQPWIIIMVPTVQWTHSDAMSTMNHHYGTYCSMNTLRRYINHESSAWHILFIEHTQMLYQPWIIIMAPTVQWTHSDAMSTMNHPLEVSVTRLQNDYEILKIIIDIIFLTIENQSEV